MQLATGRITVAWVISCLIATVTLFDAASTTGLAQVGSAEQFEISGTVAGGSGEHVIFVALWDAHGFLDRPVEQVRIDPHATPRFHFYVRAGRWAVSAFEDENNNGKLDMGLFGPKEPSGFWRPFHGWRKPRFADVASPVDHSVYDANITLRR